MSEKPICHVDLALARIRAYLASPGVSRREVARRASLGESVVRDVEAENGNPTANTLRALELVIPAAFGAAEPCQHKAV